MPRPPAGTAPPASGPPADPGPAPVRRLPAGRATALAVAAVIAVTAWFMAASAAPYGHDPSAWIVAGTDFQATSRVPAGAVRLEGTGYDGQFYFALARDPLALDPATPAALDTPAFRAQRVLLPALAWAVSGGGGPAALEWAIPALNLAGAGLLALAVALFARARGAPAWLGSAAGLLTGVLMACLRDLTEPMALAALAGGLLARERGRPALWGVLGAAACLGRESLVLAVAAVVAADLVRRRRAQALAGAGALAAFAAWQAWIRVHLGAFGTLSAGPDALSWPLSGPIEHVRTLDRLGILTAPRGLWALAFMAATAAAAAWGVRRALAERDGFALAFAAVLVLVLLSGPPLWGDAFAFGRTVAPLWLLLVLLAAAAPRAAGARLVPALSIALTLGFCVAGGIPRLPW